MHLCQHTEVQFILSELASEHIDAHGWTLDSSLCLL